MAAIYQWHGGNIESVVWQRGGEAGGVGEWRNNERKHASYRALLPFWRGENVIEKSAASKKMKQRKMASMKNRKRNGVKAAASGVNARHLSIMPLARISGINNVVMKMTKWHGEISKARKWRK
jgi:hypothetical protein